jgi:hypothetical protein
MLAMIAIGLLAFGLFGLVEAAFRRIRPVTPIHQSHAAARARLVPVHLRAADYA